MAFFTIVFLSLGKGGGGEEKRVEEPVFEPCQGLKLFSLSSAPNMTNSTYFYQCRRSSLYLTVSVYVYLFHVFAKRLPVLNITASIVTVKELVMEDASC